MIDRVGCIGDGWRMLRKARVSSTTLITSSLAAAAAVMAFAGWTLYTTTREARTAASWVVHSEEVLRTIGSFREGFATIAAGQRGYLLYGQQGFLDEREEAVERTQAALQRLRGLTGDNAVQQQRTLRLATLLAERVALARTATAAAVAQPGRPAPLSLQQQNTATEVARRTTALTAELEDAELQLLDRRHAVDAQRQRGLLVVIVASFAGISAMVLLAYAGILSESRRRRRTERQMTEIVEDLPVTVWQLRTHTDGRREFIYVGHGSRRERGLGPEELLADSDIALHSVADEDRAHVTQAMAHAEQSLEPLDCTYRLPPRITGDGPRWVHKHARLRRLEDGSLLWTGYWSDITERKEMEQALRDATAAANLANRAKSVFLATMSHEIRTPMTGVMGLLELLSLSRLDGEQRAAMTVIRESGRSLLRIIDDILDFSKIEEGRMTLAPVPASLRDAMHRACAIHSGIASSRGLLLEHAVDPRLGAAHRFDPLRVGQILNNFISNAVKFTEEGTVQVAAELVEREGDVERVRLTVTDTGIGVPPEMIAELFQPFAQGGSQIAATYGGSGLGLAICRRLAHLMGGTVAMESSLGRGTRMVFELDLPMADVADVLRTAPQAAERQLADSVSGRRAAPTAEEAEAEGTLVLVVDDHPTNRLVLSRQVTTLGYGVLMAEDGVEALALWKSHRIGMVLTDSNMPNMNGYELARAIRKLEAANGGHRVPIIACTANAMSSEAARCAAAGMDGCLIKPVDLLELLQNMEQWLPLPLGALAPALPALPAEGEAPYETELLDVISGGDPAIERQLLDDFLRANASDLHGLREAAAVEDLPEVGRLAHRMMGAAQTLGARRLLAACRDISAGAREGDVLRTRRALRELAAEAEALDHSFRRRMAGAGPT
jgi:signal transduction histidine kinase/CHASE3 domain sensor protein/ActR/RegA family two-component response regulator/HPt (histidine-containing phosphotransfer) domain-containing protein